MSEQQASRLLLQLQRELQRGNITEQRAALEGLLHIVAEASEQNQGSANQDVRRAIVQQPTALPTLQQLLHVHDKVVPALAAGVLSYLAAAGGLVALYIAAEPGVLSGLACLMQPSSTRGAQGDLYAAYSATRCLYYLTGHSMVAKRIAADAATAHDLKCALRVVLLVARRCQSRGSVTLYDASSACEAAVALHHLAAVPGSSVPAAEQAELTAVPASLLRSSYSRKVREAALYAAQEMVDTEPSKQAGDGAAQQLAANPGSIQDIVQLLGSTKAADVTTVLRSIYVTYRLMTAGNSQDEVIQAIAADRAAAAAVVRSLKVCKTDDTRKFVGGVLRMLARGERCCMRCELAMTVPHQYCIHSLTCWIECNSAL
jgi:hypothetical protein